MSSSEERLLKVGKPAHVLLSREPSHVADSERTSIAVPELRTEHRRVDTMGHQETGLAGRLLEPFDHFRIRREQQSWDPVKTSCGAEAPAFHRTQQSGRHG